MTDPPIVPDAPPESKPAASLTCADDSTLGPPRPKPKLLVGLLVAFAMWLAALVLLNVYT